MERIASVERNTNETQIQLRLEVDGEGQSNLETGCPVHEPYA